MVRLRMAGAVLGSAAVMLVAGCDGSDPQDLEEFFDGARDAVEQVEDVVDELESGLEEQQQFRPDPPEFEPIAESREKVDFPAGEGYREEALYEGDQHRALVDHYTEQLGEPDVRLSGSTRWTKDETAVTVYREDPESGTVKVTTEYLTPVD